MFLIKYLSVARGSLMQKIAIVGPSGAGKTTLAKKLSSTHDIKALHLDRLFWQRDWEKIPRDKRIDILQKRVQEKQWIIEGTYINSTNLHLLEADTIIFLDIPLLVCLPRIIKRYHKYHDGSRRRDIPEGCTEKLTILRILKVLSFPLRERTKLERNLHKFSPNKVIRLHSAKEVQSFLICPEQYIQESRQPVSIRAILEQSLNNNLQLLHPEIKYFFEYFELPQRALDTREQNFGIDHPHVALAYNSNPRE